MTSIGNIEIQDLFVGSNNALGLYQGPVVVWEKSEPPPPPAGPWLCFTANTANSTIRLDKVGSPNAISLETSTDGTTWTDYGWTDNTGDTLTMTNIGDKVYMRANTENSTIGSSTSNYYKFIGTGSFGASGNIQSLLKDDCSRTDAPSSCYRRLFQNCTSLTTAPALPATTLDSSCYVYMFNGCTSLTTAPALPATTLAITCYNYMFSGCTSLTQAPTLPATTFAYACYQNMFYGCSSLSSITVGFSDWQEANTPTTNWVYGVAASGTFTCPSGLSDIRDASHIPTGWTVVTT